MEIPEELISAFAPAGGKGVIAFVGSGPSCDAGVPGWANLIRRVAVDLGLDAEIESSLSSGRFLEAAQFLSRERSEQEVQRRVAMEVQRVTQPGRLHEVISNSPFSAVITSNYDLLLSRAAPPGKFDSPVTYRTVTVRDHFHRRFVLHLHGNVNEPETIVLTRNGYDQIVAPQAVAARQFLFSVLGGYVILFIGFGFRDDNIDAILRDAGQMEAVGYTTLFGLVPTAGPIDRVREQNLRTRRINPIYLHDAGDYGKKAICDWLADLTRSVEKIAAARLQPARAAKPVSLFATLDDLFVTDEWRPILVRALAQLPDRPDLENLVRKGLGHDEVRTLWDRVSADELRRMLIATNQERQSAVIENVLSCLPPDVR